MTNAMSDEDARHVAVAKTYFERADAGRADIAELMTEDVQVYFPKYGVGQGVDGFFAVAAALASRFASSEHDYSDYTFLPSGDHLIVEGTTRGVSRDGNRWAGGETPGGRFCNVFQFRDGKIARVHVYLDPDYLGEDEDRFLWGRTDRRW